MTELFHQIYNPLGGNVLFSALVAAVPPLLLALLLAVLRVAPWRAAVAAAATAFVLAWLGWGKAPPLTIGAATHRGAVGPLAIPRVVVRAALFYNPSPGSGGFGGIRRSLSMLTGHRRTQP